MTFNFDPFPELETQRLNLRDFCEDDYARVFFLRSDKEVNKYIKRAYPKKIEEAISFVKKVQVDMSKGRNVNWAICKKDIPEMIGSICLWNFSDDHKTGEVGYDLHPNHQKKGIMNEALKAVLNYGFKELKLDRITAYTHHSNKASIKLLEKNSFLIQPDEKDLDNEDNIILFLERSHHLTKQMN